MTRLTFRVTVEVSKVSGVFVGRDELADALGESISSGAYDANLSGMGAQGDSEYQVDDVDVAPEA